MLTAQVSPCVHAAVLLQRSPPHIKDDRYHCKSILIVCQVVRPINSGAMCILVRTGSKTGVQEFRSHAVFRKQVISTLFPQLGSAGARIGRFFKIGCSENSAFLPLPPGSHGLPAHFSVLSQLPPLFQQNPTCVKIKWCGILCAMSSRKTTGHKRSNFDETAAEGIK